MRRLLIAVAACVVAVALPTPARAQSPLLNSFPEAGGTVASGMNAVALTFDQLGPDGAKISINGPFTVLTGRPVVVDNETLCAAVQPLVDGSYTLVYNATSADGAPINGTISFKVAPNGQFAGIPQPCDKVDLPTAFPVRGGYADLAARTISPIVIAGAVGVLLALLLAGWYFFRPRRST
jgi:hypothetical protein